MRRIPLFPKFFAGFYGKPPTLEAFPPSSDSRVFFASRLFLRRFPLFLKFLKWFCEKPPIVEAIPPFILSPLNEFCEKPPTIDAFSFF